MDKWTDIRHFLLTGRSMKFCHVFQTAGLIVSRNPTPEIEPPICLAEETLSDDEHVLHENKERARESKILLINVATCTWYTDTFTSPEAKALYILDLRMSSQI